MPSTTANDAAVDAATRPTWVGRVRSATRRNWPLIAIALAGLLLRLLFVTVWWPTCDYDASIWTSAGVTLEQGTALLKNPQRECFDVASGDAAFYFGQGKMLSEGQGMGSPFRYFLNGEYQPSAAHPPGYPAFLALTRMVGLDTVAQERIASTFLGALGVFLIGLAAQRLTGRRTGIVAAVLAATYPMLWINDGRLMSESLYIPAVAAILIACDAFWKHPRPKTAVWLGLAIAAGQYCRMETGMLAWIMVPFLAYGVRQRMSRTGWLKLGALTILVAQLAVMPWTLRNLTSFNRPVFGTAGVGIVLLSGSCDAAYDNDDLIGYLNFACLENAESMSMLLGAVAPGSDKDESDVDYEAREKAISYIKERPGRTVVVAAARFGRMWDLYRPGQNIDVDVAIEIRPRIPSILGRVMYFAMLPFAVIGLVTLRRRKLPISPYIAIFVMTTFVALISFALSRYRVPSEVALVVLAAVGVDTALREWWDRRRSRPAVSARENSGSMSA